MKESQSLQGQAYDYLIEMIKDGELEAGKIYSLNQMAQKAGVSRTPFRDAVLRLEQVPGYAAQQRIYSAQYDKRRHP